MGIKVRNLKEEYKELVAERDALDNKIKALARMIDAYSSKRSTNKQKTGATEFDSLVRAVFQDNQNQALRVRDIVAGILAKNTGLDKKSVGNKMLYAIRMGVLKNEAYGKYTFRNSLTEDSK